MSKRPGSTTATSTKTSTTASETESTTQETTPVKPKRQRQSKKAAAVAAAAAAADTAATKATEPTEPSIPSPWAAVTPAPTAHLDIDSSLVEKSEGPGKLSLSSEGNESLKRSLPATKSKKADATALLASSSTRPAVPATTPATQPTISNETTSIISTTNSAATPSATTTTTAIATSNATATMAVPTVSGNREPMHKPVKLPEHPPTVTTRSDLRQLYRLFKDAHKEHLRLYRRLTSDVERCEMAERTWKMATDRAVQEEAAQVLEQLMTRASGTASRRRQERYEFLRTWIQEAKQEARRAVEENGWDD
ncbi:hypothetical protein BDF19DRAFT_426874 [Syncephalis fuscata]|nr:hypothetical protein BDF19DRAFT_426874 [Syncephalis fuscata]